ncbi:hypothetical protein PSU4_17060 [Pseudonocardia sulfidoxydans NBRC 16205]|uniref:Uncharacterized protein n=1 Tax=Pseudonocardia sulfidoxydans NBRC 16205 TaxID=1223511 RepID=A0A511DD80_9PSEU|nr:hypothetical protein PSU4_17060 [Pseudonocardia sulfidoxydans NBRC 16205]
MSQTPDDRGVGGSPVVQNNRVRLGGGTDSDRSAHTADYIAGLRRRQAAALRCEPLDTGHRDPHTDATRDHVDPRTVESWRAAWSHLAAAGHDVGWAVPDPVRAYRTAS